MNRDFSGFVFPHQHPTLGRRPVPALPFQLQQSIVVAHDPVFAYHSFFLQPEHFVQLPRRRPSPMILGGSCCRMRVTPVVFGEIVLLQIRVRMGERNSFRLAQALFFSVITLYLLSHQFL